MAEDAEPHLTATDQKAWLDRLETEHDNLRSALAWTSTPGGDAVAGLRLAGAIWRFWYVRGYLGEGRAWLSRMLLATRSDEPTAAARAKALDGAGMLARRQGDYAAARALHEEALVIQRGLGDRRGIASSLSNLGIVAREQNDYATAKALYGESLALRRELGDQWGIGAALNNLGLVVLHDGDFPAARALYGESLKVFRDLGNRQAMASPLSNLGLVAYHQGDYAGARALIPRKPCDLLRTCAIGGASRCRWKGLPTSRRPRRGRSRRPVCGVARSGCARRSGARCRQVNDPATTVSSPPPGLRSTMTPPST